MMTFLPPVDTGYHPSSTGMGSAAEVLTPFLSQQYQPPSAPPSSLPPPQPTQSAINKRAPSSSVNPHHPLGVVASTTSGGDANGQVGRPMPRTMSSSSDQSTQSCPSSRRVIFPSLHHQTSLPDRACSLGSQTGEQRKRSNSLPFSPERATKRETSLTMEQPTCTEQRSLSQANDDDPSTTITSVNPPMRPAAQGQRLILPQQAPKDAFKGSCGIVPLISILRPSRLSKKRPAATTTTAPASPRSVKDPVDKIPSVESDIPSLASTISQSSAEDSTVAPKAAASTSPPRNTAGGLSFSALPPPRIRSTSLPVSRADCQKATSKAIAFDPRVWVREFERSPSEEAATWYSNQDLEVFKADAIKLIMEHTETELVPTGTGRFVPRKVVPTGGKALFSHKALRMAETEGNEQPQKQHQQQPQAFNACCQRQVVQEREIRRILIVDPHDICVKLFSKGFKNVLPHVQVVGVSSGEEALKQAQAQPFDIVLVEERLKLFHQQRAMNNKNNVASGGALIRSLKNQCAKTALYIGVSTRLKEDGPKLQHGGADLLWPKPPPKLDQVVVKEILLALLQRRGQTKTLRDLSPTTSN